MTWFDAAVAWIDERLAAVGRERTGPVEQPRVRPWGTVLTAPTAQGAVWFKAGAPATAFEAGLYAVLARHVPERILPPIAIDAARGWLLLPDGGLPLGARLRKQDQPDALVDALVHYGRLQRTLAPHVDELLAAGVPDMRPAAMPERFEQALDAIGDHPVRAAVEPLRDDIARSCEQLAASAVAASLDHNDLHPHNVLEGPRYYDWGDAVVAHPFAAMLVPLGFVERMDAARDAYLAVFADLAPHAELVATLELACHVGKIARALTWERALRSAGEQGEPVPDAWAAASANTLALLLDASPLGRA